MAEIVGRRERKKQLISRNQAANSLCKMGEVTMAEIVGRRERKKQLSRQAILKAAQQLFTVRGYKETSVADIMNGADLGTGTFYNYFQSKEEVLMALLGDSVEMVEAAVRESRERGDKAVETLAAGIMATSTFLDENRYVLPLFLSASERAAESHHPQGMGHPGAGHGSATPGFKARATAYLQRVMELETYVGEGHSHKGLSRSCLRIRPEDVHWMRPGLEMVEGETRRLKVRVRYRQPLQDAFLLSRKEGLFILFDMPQRGLSHGQFAAWYTSEGELLGSGVY